MRRNETVGRSCVIVVSVDLISVSMQLLSRCIDRGNRFQARHNERPQLPIQASDRDVIEFLRVAPNEYVLARESPRYFITVCPAPQARPECDSILSSAEFEFVVREQIT